MRQAPLNAIWEGSSNVQALDVLRTCSKHPESLSVFFAQLRRTRGSNAALDAFTDHVEALSVRITTDAESATFARHLLESLALVLQGHALALGAEVDAGVRRVFALWCSLRLPARPVRGGTLDGQGVGAPLCFGALSPTHLRQASEGAGDYPGRDTAIIDAIIERELSAIVSSVER